MGCDSPSIISDISNLYSLLSSLVTYCFIDFIDLFKEPDFHWLISLLIFWFHFHWFLLWFYYFLLLTLDLICSSLSGFLRWKLRWLTLDLLFFLLYAYNAIHSPPSTALAASHTFWWVVFSLVQTIVKSSWDFAFDLHSFSMCVV